MNDFFPLFALHKALLVLHSIRSVMQFFSMSLLVGIVETDILPGHLFKIL